MISRDGLLTHRALVKLRRITARTTRALQQRNYRVFFIGQLFSLMGTWITNVATSWLIYRLTGSVVLLGLVSFASQFPAFLVSPFAGVHVDRLNKKKVLIATQILAALQSLILGILTITGLITVPLLLLLGIAQAVIDGFYIPARQTFISELLERRADLANAIALNSASFHMARLVGPAIGGILIAVFGEGPCFLIDAVSYLAVLFSLFTIRSIHITPPQSNRSVLEELREGVAYIRSHETVRLLLSHMSFICLVGIAHSVLLPVLVRDIYNVGPDRLGFLIGASGFGSLLGALALATQTSVDKLPTKVQRASFCFALSVILLSLSPNEHYAIPALILCGFFFISVAASSNTLVQTSVEDRYRGRVMSFFAMTFTGMMPLGSMAAGFVAEHFGVQRTILMSGILCLAGAAALLIEPHGSKPLRA